MRSTVIAPPPAPPAPRPTVVLRAGPPPKTGRSDLVIGAIGLVLLLSTVGLAVALPHKDELPQQFKVAWLDEPHDLTSQSFAFSEGADGRVHDFLYDVPDDDAYLITVKYGFTDDLAASLPDQFMLQLYDPGGNPVGPKVYATNLPGTSLGPVGQDPVTATPDYVSVLHDSQFSVAMPKPADDILEVQDQSVNATALGRELEAKAHLATSGQWKLRVTLVTAGDCPAPTDKESANRALVCRQELQEDPQAAAQGQDAGNLFTVGVFSYTRFAPDIQKLG